MANDLFSGLGGLMKGLSGLMPQDDPAVKLMTAQTEVSNLKKQEAALYAEIGKLAAERYGLDSFGEIADKLKLVQVNLHSAESALNATKAQQEEAEAKAKATKDAHTCPNCGHVNQEGIKFCQECGTKLGAPAKSFCTSCGAELAAGARFCGECGARQGE